MTSAMMVCNLEGWAEQTLSLFITFVMVFITMAGEKSKLGHKPSDNMSISLLGAASSLEMAR